MQKYIISLLLLFSAVCNAQQWQNKVDSIKIVNRQLREYKGGASAIMNLRGYIVPFDADNNINTGLNNTISGINNYLNGDWITVSGSGNMIQANHARVTGNNGAFFGADHGTNTPCSEDYGFVANDANENHGASGSVFGFFNINYDENGFVFGDDNILGSGIGSAKYSGILGGRNSRKTGNCGMTIGRRLDSQGDDIYLFGRGFSDTQRLLWLEAKSFAIGFNSTIPTFIVHAPATAGINAVGTTEMRGDIKNLPPEYPNNATALAALGDSMYYRSWDGEKWQVCVTTEQPAFMVQPQDDPIIKTINIQDAAKMNGTWYNIQGQAVKNPQYGVYYFIEK